MTESTEIVLPDLFSLTPIVWAGCNPYFSKDDNYSIEWILGYGVLTDKMRTRVEASFLEVMGANSFNYVDAKRLRVANDCIMLTAAIEEITDVMDFESAATAGDLFVRAMNGTAGDDGSPVTVITREYVSWHTVTYT